MKGFNRKVVIGLGLAAAMAGNAYAAPIVNVTNSDGDLYNTEMLTGYSTDGSLMDGMEITTCFASAACETVAFDGTVGSTSYGEASAVAGACLSTGTPTTPRLLSIRFKTSPASC